MAIKPKALERIVMTSKKQRVSVLQAAQMRFGGEESGVWAALGSGHLCGIVLEGAKNRKPRIETLAPEYALLFLAGNEEYQVERTLLVEPLDMGNTLLQVLDAYETVVCTGKRGTVLVELDAEAVSVVRDETADRSYVSDKLQIVNQAAAKYWANANRDDRATHPSNRVVQSWLQSRGISETPAKHAASLIRPEWAQTGRKPKE